MKVRWRRRLDEGGRADRAQEREGAAKGAHLRASRGSAQYRASSLCSAMRQRGAGLGEGIGVHSSVGNSRCGPSSVRVQCGREGAGGGRWGRGGKCQRRAMGRGAAVVFWGFRGKRQRGRGELRAGV